MQSCYRIKLRMGLLDGMGDLRAPALSMSVPALQVFQRCSYTLLPAAQPHLRGVLNILRADDDHHMDQKGPLAVSESFSW
jgi:hypothetical protein